MENGEKKTVSRIVTDREVIMRKYHVHIKNFRNLKDVKVTLSPLTILTGENGSGKSTFFKALLFLKHNHTHEAAKKLKYVIEDDINLGGWDQIANDPKKPISIKIIEETWGYDHQVEEIYDIDNCPFELNPTDEYAERLWKSLFEETHLTKRENVIDQSIVSTNRTRNFVRTKKTSSFEYVFSKAGLEFINVSMNNGKLTFSRSYNVPPFTDEVKIIFDKMIPPELADYYVVISNFHSDYWENAENLQAVFANVAFGYLLYRAHLNREKFGEFIPRKAVFWEESLSNDSLFQEYFGLFLLSFSEVSLKESQVLISEFNEFIIDSGKLIPNWLCDIVSFGTTREIPQPYYFTSQLRNATYYKMLSVIRKNNNTIDFYENQVIWQYISNFNSSLKRFELGKRIELDEGDILTTLNLVTMANKRVLLAEASSGTLQLLPILFTLAFNPSDKSTYFIQQPELHLHPRLQAQLSQFWTDSISPHLTNDVHDFAIQRRAKQRTFGSEKVMRNSNELIIDIKWGDEDENDYKGTYFIDYTVPTHLIIETHSEHLLKKLQVLVSQGKTLQLWPEGHCSGEDVKLKDALSIYYFAKDAKGNIKAIELELDDNGFFKTETPKGFFDESLDLNRQLLLGRN